MARTTFKVLSIDFDFFQNTTKELIKNFYPDGIDLSPSISEIVWASKYCNNPFSKDNDDEQTLFDVTINQELFSDIKSILLNQDFDTNCFICQSHVSLYHILKDLDLSNKNTEIYNLDFHHDLFNDNSNIDCGNWLGKFKDVNKNTFISWYTRETALECYNFNQNELDNVRIYTNIKYLLDTKFDLIFLCRSDAWTPPHLDIYFDELVSTCKSVFKVTSIDKSMHECRDILRVMSLTNSISSIYDEFKNKRYNCNANNNTTA